MKTNIQNDIESEQTIIQENQSSGIETQMFYIVDNIKFVDKFPNNNSEKLWSADVKAGRLGGSVIEFNTVFFHEQGGNAAIYGIEEKDSFPSHLKTDLALKQQEFIKFLYGETKRKNEFFGYTSASAETYNYCLYSQMAIVTAAYIHNRGLKLNMGVGFYNKKTRGYEVFAVDPEDDQGYNWMDDVKESLEAELTKSKVHLIEENQQDEDEDVKPTGNIKTSILSRFFGKKS